MYKVLFVSYANWDSSSEIPAILKKGGCSVTVFAVKNAWALKNRFHDAWIEAPAGEQAFVDALIALVEQSGSQYDWILQADDEIIRLLNERLTDETLFYKMLPLTRIENRMILGSKAGFSSLCSEYSIKTPGYRICREGDSVTGLAAEIGYPLVMKVDQSQGGAGVFFCENEADLSGRLSTVTNKQNVVLQQYVKGDEINAEALYRNGELLVYNYSRTTRAMGKFGISTERLFYTNPSVEADMVKIGRSFGVSGFANIVFMHEAETNTHFLIEVDIRPNSWMYYGRFTGNDFATGVKKIVKNDLALVKPPEKLLRKAIKITLYKRDVYRGIMERDVKGLIGWLYNKNGRWKYIPFYDRKLLAASSAYLFASLVEVAVPKIRKTLGLKERQIR